MAFKRGSAVIGVFITSVTCTEVHLKIPEAIDILSLKLYSIELELPVKL